MRSSNRFFARRIMLGGFGLVALLTAAPLTADAKTLYIQVRNAKLRAAPLALGSIVADLQYGDAVRLLSQKGSWIEARVGRRTGYLHKSAVSQHRVKLGGAAGPSAADTGSTDVIVAGKGFSREVEQRYSSGQSGLNYYAVDAMERRTIPENELRLFVRNGKLLEEK